MAILRYAKKSSYGAYSGFGMFLGHYLGWIAAGIMGAGAGVLLQKPVVALDPGDVAFYALGASGFVIVNLLGGSRRMPIYTGPYSLHRPSLKINREKEAPSL